jgi:hypothetical protein
MDWARIRSECRGRVIDFVRSQNLNLAAADFLMAEAPRLELLAAALASGELSYGDYNRRFTDLSLATMQEAHAINGDQQRQAEASAAAARAAG